MWTSSTLPPGPCCGLNPNFVSFTNGVGSGACGNFRSFDGSQFANLACGGLYFGGGENSVPLPAITPDFTSSVTKVLSCTGQTATLDFALTPAAVPLDVVVVSATGQEQQKRELTWMNHGFTKVERLPGNIGYIDFRGFMDPDLAADTVAAAMNFVNGTVEGGGPSRFVAEAPGRWCRKTCGVEPPAQPGDGAP